MKKIIEHKQVDHIKTTDMKTKFLIIEGGACHYNESITIRVKLYGKMLSFDDDSGSNEKIELLKILETFSKKEIIMAIIRGLY